MSVKEYTVEDVISILDFSKNKNIKSEEVLLQWKLGKSNCINKEDEHGLSVVGIFEHPIKNKSNKEIGKIIIFNYTGVGGGWHNDIYKMVEEKYFSDQSYYRFRSGDNESFYYRLFLTGDVFSDESFAEWERPKKKKDFRVFKQKLPKSEFIIHYDMSENRIGSDMISSLEHGSSGYCMFWDDSYCRYYVKNISEMNFKPSRPIIEKIIKKRIK